MATDQLRVQIRPVLTGGKLILSFSGWMDGGEVSTGTVRRLINELGAKPIAEIDPENFYIYNIPGAMDIPSLFRPYIKIKDGLVMSFNPPTNTFYCDEVRNLIFFVGKEPNLNWRQFGDSIFDLASQVGVSTILFVGSFGGTVPHTREPRLYVTVSDANLKPMMQKYGLRPTNYEGPGSFSSYLMSQAKQRGFEMTSVVAEIPGYLQGPNPMSIEAVTRKLAAILCLRINLDQLRSTSDEWESRVSAKVEDNPELEKQIRELEHQYDDDLIDPGVDG